jgi:hypothetical protein
MGKRKMDYVEVDSNDEEVEAEDRGEQEEEEQEEEDDKQEEDQEDQEEDEDKQDKDKEEQEEDEEEDIPLPTKYGPPNGKTKKSQPSTQLDPNAAAGPSKIPPPKRMSKKKAGPSSIPHVKKKDDAPINRPNTRNSGKNIDTKKRKAEEELGTAQDPKRPKTADTRKSGRKPGKVRLEEPVKVSNPDQA